MNKRLLAVAALGLLIVGAVLWLAFGRGSGKHAPAPRQPVAGSSAAPVAHKKVDGAGPGGPGPILARDADPAGPLLLEGSVLDEHDQAVAGAEVWISSAPQRTAKTDTDGSFSFDKLLGRTYSIGARAGDRIGGPVTTKLIAGGEPVVIRLRPGAQLAVTVHDAAGDKPITGATVTLVDPTEPTATTDADGHALFKGVGDGFTTVRATADGYGPSSSTLIVGKTQHTAEVTITLSRGAAVSGIVVDDGGAPIKDAKVTAADVSVAWDNGGGDKHPAITDAKGEFTIAALSAGSYRVSAADETHAPAASDPITVDGEHATTGVRIVMPAGAQVAGVVVDADGKPAPYATVKLSGTEWAADMVYRQAAADDRGAFSVDALPRRAVKLRAESELASSELTTVDLVAVAKRTDVRLVLDQAGTIAGIVVDGAGQPVAEASVSGVPDFLADDRQGNDFILASTTATTTDGGGRFTLRGLDDGTYRLAASREGHGERAAWSAGSVAVKAGATDVRLVLPTPGGVKGKIALDRGEPPALAIVAAGGNRETTRNGEFTLGDMTPGTYDLRVTGPDFGEAVRADVLVEDGKVTDVGTIEVTEGRRASGRLVDGKGDPVEGAKVMVGKMIIGDGKSSGASDDDGVGPTGVRTAVTNADGEFAVRGISRDGGVVVAEHPTRGRTISVSVPPGTADVTGLRLVLRGYGSLAGTVTRKGAPVSGAAVSAAPSGSSGQAVFVTTGADGKFVLDKLPEGPTTVQAMKQVMMSSFSASKNVVVVAGKVTAASVDIPAGDVELDVKIAPKPGATVNAAFMILVRGSFVAKDGAALMDAYLAGTGAKDGAAGTTLWLGGATPVPFMELVAGTYSVCALPITGNITDAQLSDRINANLDKLEAVCQGVVVSDTPKLQQITMALPQMRSLAPPKDEPPAPKK